MDLKSFPLVDDARHHIGRTFTPLEWALWCITEHRVYERWLKGASVLDPTCGNGIFLEAFVAEAIKRGDHISSHMLRNLNGIEINPSDKINFIDRLKQEYDISFPAENYLVADFLTVCAERKFDISVGNPPWANFTDLPDRYKDFVKNQFVKYGLVKNKKDVLLGSSRGDIASLIIQKLFSDHMVEGGEGYFFLPLSLFFNDGANEHFRPSAGTDNVFNVATIHDFETGLVFPEIKTRNGFAHLTKTLRSQKFPVPLYLHFSRSEREATKCGPSNNHGAWMREGLLGSIENLKKISVLEQQKPRQGFNTGGLNKAFIFELCGPKDEQIGEVENFINGFGQQVTLQTKYIFPLMHTGLFSGNEPKKSRYILCLHDRFGKPISRAEISTQFGVQKYLDEYEYLMANRKGVLINGYIAKGRFWSLLGVGPYSFEKYKVAWESLGKKKFHAVVLDGNWQGNQAMHAYIPSPNIDDAKRICSELNEIMPSYLESIGMEGTCNWAQPGRVKKILDFSLNQQKLFAFS